jgi:hypothetical protein
MTAAGNWSRNSRINGVANNVSPIPASEITRIFLGVFKSKA